MRTDIHYVCVYKKKKNRKDDGGDDGDREREK